MRRWLFAASALVAVSVMVAACGVGNDCDFGLCAGPLVGSDGGDGGTDGPPVVPTDCDLAKSPKDSKPCVDDTVGIFVDRNGKPGAAGTMKDPVPSITEAIARATTAKRARVYICDGKYDEAIKLTSAISVYGGFDCSWNNTGVKPRIASAKGAALELTSVTTEIIVEDLDLMGLSDPGIRGASAIAALVVNSKLSLRRTTVTAGVGQDGNKGKSNTNYSDLAAAGIAGNAATGGAGGKCTCTDMAASTGGRGADGSGAGLSDGASVPSVGTPNAGSSSTTTCVSGGVGAGGNADGTGEPVSAPGRLSATGWDLSKRGDVGKNGRPGQGGGGGGAKMSFNAAGGGGGCGGCGGAGAESGGNGGASIAIAAFGSTLLIDASSIVTAGGGKGGEGGTGQNGQTPGGAGGSAACEGGAGGHGAGGGGGAGGAGGDSFAIAWAGGTQPKITTTELKPGGPGGPGDGGTPGTGGGKPGTAGKLGNAGAQVPVFQQQ